MKSTLQPGITLVFSLSVDLIFQVLSRCVLAEFFSFL
jgi:hypothetical protein